MEIQTPQGPGRVLSGPPGPKVVGESGPGSDKLSRHLPDKVSSTSSSSGAGPRRKGWGEPSPAAFVLRDKRSHVPLPGGAQRRYPRPAPPRPATTASSPPARCLCLGPGDPAQGHGRFWGLGAGGGDAQSEPVGASSAPQSQQQTAFGRTDARAEVRTLGGVRLHPLCPAPRWARAT